MEVETVNATGWRALKRRLKKTTAHAILAQETWVGQAHIPAASEWAKKNGWKSIWGAATVGPGGGPSAGVAVLVRDYLGLRYPQVGSHVWHDARAVAGVIDAPSFRPLILVSAYLHAGQGPSPANLRILADIGEAFKAQGEGWQMAMGADANMEPEDLAETGFDRRAKVTLMYPATERGTFRTAATASTLDYFAVSDPLAAAVETVGTVEASGVKGHVPVVLRFKPRATALRALHLRKPPELARERVYGPLLPPPDAAAAMDAAVVALAEARAQGSDVQSYIDGAYAQWADIAEEELAIYAGTAVKKRGERAKLPNVVWRSVVPERPPQLQYPRAAALSWLRGVLGELIRMGTFATNGTSEDDAGGGRADDPTPPATDVDMTERDATTAADDSVHGERLGDDSDDDASDGEDADAGSEDRRTTRNHRRRRAGRPPTAVEDCHRVLGEICASLRRDVPGGPPDQGVEQHHAAVVRLADTMLEAMTSDAEGRSPRRTWREVRAADVAAAADAARSARDSLDADIRQAEAQRDADEQAAWKAWVAEGIEAGASRAHAFSRLPTGWTPTTAAVEGGAISSSPDALLEAQRAKYRAYWKPVNAPFRYVWDQVDDELPLLEPHELRQTALSFAWKTTQTYDGFHPRQIAHLSDGALSVLATLLQATEVAGVWPRQVSLVVTALLPKPAGGFRPIGVLPAVYRVWAKARRPESDKWERQHARPYLSAAKGNGPVDTMWRLNARQEAGAADGLQAAVVAEDLQAFFDTIDRGRLVEEARALGYPMPLLRAALAAYSMARVMTLQGRIAREMFPTTGVIAGCSLAMALTKVYYLRSLDTFVAQAPAGVTLDAHVDDLTLAATGTSTAVVDDLAEAHAALRQLVTDDLGCAFAAGKTAITASARSVAAALTRRLGVGGGVAGTACLLGIDSTAGAPRSRLRVNSKKAARLRAALARRQRLSRLRKAVGVRAVRVFRAGVQPAATFDAAVWGLSDGEVLALRRLAASTMSPKAKGRSLTMLHLWHHMPTAAAEHAPALQYARIVWKAIVDREDATSRGSSAADLRRQFEAARVAFQPLVDSIKDARGEDGTTPSSVAKKAWAQARGPYAAAALTFARLGWSFVSAFEVRDDRGATMLLTRTSPAMLANLMHASLVRATERRMASIWSSANPEFAGRRVCIDLATALARAGRDYTPMQAAAFRAVACGAVMTNQRARDLGYDTSGLCSLCGQAPDTVDHRTYSCPATRAAVRAAVPAWFWREAQRTSARGKFWTTACFPHPADVAPLPRSDMHCQVERLGDHGSGDGLMDIGDHVYVDGSSTAHVIKDLARAGCAVVQTTADGTPTKILQVPVPLHLPQTSQASEHLGMGIVFVSLKRAARVVGDCLNVVRAVTGAARRALDPRSMYAGLTLTTRADPERRRLATAVEWTKAHRKPTGNEPPDVARDIKGNDAADEAARQAVKLHPPLGPEAEASVAFHDRRARHVVRAVVTAMELFPRAEKNMRRLPKPVDERQARERQQHHWVYTANAWRCTVCRDYVTAPSVPPYRQRQKCCGQAPEADATTFTDGGHHICKAEASLPIIFCARCGAWGNRRTPKLGRQCAPPTTAGVQALRRIEQGWHPLLQKDAYGRDLPRQRLVVTAAFDPRSREWRQTNGSRHMTDHPHPPTTAATTDATQGLAQGTPSSGGAGSAPPTARDTPSHTAAPLCLATEDSDAPMEHVYLGMDACHSDEDVFGHGGGARSTARNSRQRGGQSPGSGGGQPRG